MTVILFLSGGKGHSWFYTLYADWKVYVTSPKLYICKKHQQIKTKVKSKVQENVRRNSENYLSIHRGVVSPFARQVPCASAGSWPQQSTDGAPLSLPTSASFACKCVLHRSPANSCRSLAKSC